MSSTSFASPADAQTVNSVSVETADGYKTFNLVHGDITVLPTDLLVVSTHGNPTKPPTGAVARGLRSKYGISIDMKCHWLNYAEDCWTCFQEHQETTPFQAILTVCIPLITRYPDPLDFFDEAVRGVFASVAALEYMGRPFPIISLPVLHGTRLIAEHRTGAIERLIRHGLHWLKNSNHTHTIQFVVYQEDEIETWDAAMNACMGRSLIAAGTDGVINSLCQEIRQQATAQSNVRFQAALEPLAHALAHPDKLYVQSICVSGRKLVEEMLVVLMSQWQIKWEGSLLKDILTLEKSNHVAPWITSYMHSLRVFGNEEVHSKAQPPEYRPTGMDKGDLVSALCAIRALLSAWPEIQKGYGVSDEATGE